MSSQNHDLPEVPFRFQDEEAATMPAFLLHPIDVLRRRARWVLLAAVLGCLGTAIAVALWSPIYIAASTILITNQQIPEDFVRSTVRESSIANINAMVGRVLAQANLADLVEEYQLYGGANDETMDVAVERVRAHTVIEPEVNERGRDASIVYSVSFEYPDAEKAATVANELAGLFVDASLARRNAQARRATEFLKRELQRDEQELAEQARLVSEFRQSHRGALPDELDTSMRKLELLSRERDTLVMQIAQLESQAAGIMGPGGAAGSDSALLLAELRRQLAREVAVNTEEHPNVVSLRRKVASQEKLVASEAGEGDHGRLGLLRSRLATVEGRIAALNDRIDRIPGVGEQLAALENKESVLREDYLQTLRKVEAAELAESMESTQQGGQVSILDRAFVPTNPKHSRSVVLFGGLAATLVLALGLAVLLEVVDPVVVNIQQIEEIAGIPSLGSIPRVA